MGIGALALVGALAAAGGGEVHLGAGWMAAQAAEQLEPPQPAPAKTAKAPPLPVLPTGTLPPSNFDMVRHSRGARAAAVSVALAVQGAMIIYGILSLREQREEAALQRSEGGPVFNPYPR